jgi:glycopeptide antibiotics resistance protein
MTTDGTRDRKIVTFLCLLFGAALLYAALMPHNFTWDMAQAREGFRKAFEYWPTGEILHKADLVQNFLLFIPLGFLIMVRCLLGRGNVIVGLLTATLFSALISGMIEMGQLFLDASDSDALQRIPSISDFTTNSAGGLAGAILAVTIGLALWKTCSGNLRRWRLERPALLVALVMMLLLALDASAPFRPTLDLGTVWRNVKAGVWSVSEGFSLHPWHHWLVRRIAVYAVLSALLAAGMAREGRSRRLSALLLTAFFAVVIEYAKPLFIGRTFNVANPAASAIGAGVGWMLGAFMAGLSSKGQALLGRRLIVSYMIYAAWQPFKLNWGSAAIKAKIPEGIAWLPISHYALSALAKDVINFSASIVLAAALAFARRLIDQYGERPGPWSRPMSAAVRLAVLGLILELGQFLIDGRMPTTTDVACFAIGGYLGCCIAGRFITPKPEPAEC